MAQAHGGIDYVKGIVTAVGIGAPNPNMPVAVQRPAAIRAAKADAFRNLLETAKGVQVNAETTVENYMLASDFIHTQVEGIVQGFTVTDTKYMSDGTVEVTVEMPLVGDFADVILDEEMGGHQPLPAPREGSPMQGQVFSGLIIDARGLGIQPAMAPKVLNDAGNEVYGTGYVSREYAVQMGIVGYTKNIDQAKADERTGDNPFTVKGIITPSNLEGSGLTATINCLSKYFAVLITNPSCPTGTIRLLGPKRKFGRNDFSMIWYLNSCDL